MTQGKDKKRMCKKTSSEEKGGKSGPGNALSLQKEKNKDPARPIILHQEREEENTKNRPNKKRK